MQDLGVVGRKFGAFPSNFLTQPFSALIDHSISDERNINISTLTIRTAVGFQKNDSKTYGI
jgi:hypothetical protein